MQPPAPQARPAARVLFLTRDPIVHLLGGSTTYAVGLIRLLLDLGATVTVLSTIAASRSPRPWFFVKSKLPAGVPLRVPGYLHLGGVYLRVWSPRAWGRYLLRAAERWAWAAPWARLARRIYGAELCGYAWDLTPPIDAERALLLAETTRLRPTTVIANYAYWGAVLADAELRRDHPAMKRTILMHDLLSARVRSFEAQGRELDCPYIDEETELRWLGNADTLLAAQAREADTIAQRLSSRVVVLPVAMSARVPAIAPEAGRCLFVGSLVTPNENALTWLLDRVWPKVLARCPSAQLAVVGTVAHAFERRPGVHLVGPVASLEEQYERAMVCLVPLRLGSGIKIKLLEALSFGKAIVSTSVGVEGLEDVTAGIVHVADEPEAFAAQIVGLLTDSVARRTCEQRAYTLARVQFDPRRQLDPAFLEAVL